LQQQWEATHTGIMTEIWSYIANPQIDNGTHSVSSDPFPEFVGDEAKADWVRLIQKCRYVVLDGQHRLQALNELKEAKSSKFPPTINCWIMQPLNEEEAFTFSERANYLSQSKCVKLTYFDKIVHVDTMKRLRWDPMCLVVYHEVFQ
jgi:hypothetical protein